MLCEVVVYPRGALTSAGDTIGAAPLSDPSGPFLLVVELVEFRDDALALALVAYPGEKCVRGCGVGLLLRFVGVVRLDPG